MHIYAYMNAIANDEKEALCLKSRRTVWQGLKGGKGIKNYYYIIISTLKFKKLNYQV